MPTTKKTEAYEISEDMNFQRKEWNVERWGWVFMLIIIIAALLGLFGEGPLSAATAENGDLQVRYNRFERQMAVTQLIMQLKSASAQNGEVRLTLDENLLEAYTVQNIIPEPDSVALSSNAYVYTFKIQQAGEPAKIIFNLQSNRLGPASGQVRLENGSVVQLRQFIYP